jgi:HK97 family phage prohead protease
MIRTKSFDVKADNGSITGYASTWTREPDSYGDIVAKGAFAEHIAQIKEEGRVLPFLFNHGSDNLQNYIGTVTNLEEDDHGLKFDAVFDDTPEAQKARKLSMDGRLAKFSFAYDVLDAGEVELEDGRKANELRKLNIHEVSLVLYPANPDTSVVSVKSGRRNSAKDADAIREAISLLQGVLGELDDIEEDPQDSDAKSEERDTANDEEQKRKAELLEHANKLLKEVNHDS